MDDRNPEIDAHLRFPHRERVERGGRRCCVWPGCEEPGEHRAPRARTRLREYDWYCLEHIRAFNQRWNYFAGMSEAEIDAHRRADATWHRPTWRAGSAPWARGRSYFDDPFTIFEDDTPPERPAPDARTAQMMSVLGLERGFTHEALRHAYKAQVKRWHPDLHGGDKAAEERLRLVIEAYRHLRDEKAWSDGPSPAP